MKKRLINIISILISLIVFSSCEKVIQLDLNKENPQLVIEAILNVDSTEQFVYLTKTVNFDNEGAGVPFVNASVQLMEGESTIATFNHIGNGVFKTKLSSLLTVGKQYTLQVEDNEKKVTHVATSICPAKVKLDTIEVYKNPPVFGRYNYAIVPVRNEPIGKNWYQFRLKKNDEKIHKILVDDDSNLDGVPRTLKPIFNVREFSPDTTVNSVPKWIIKKAGAATELVDSVEAELTLVNIEYKVFRYLYNLALNQGGRQSATPTNPDPIFTNGALGYFSIQSTDTKKIWVNNKLKL
ncbi:MAG: DUF4249 domain-containing protein [Crocinitomicaceae bacterium]|nr:DUF4249 domain-containing protein [Crocinitomicaceae bacterium]